MGLSRTGRRIAVQGTVQGVGFRPWVYQLARRLDLRGSVRNGPAGVTIEAYAPPPVLDTLLECLETELPPTAHIDHLEWEPLQGEPPQAFAILPSELSGTARASIPADLAMCDACRAEIHDPTARRYRYAFTNCTHCGPRFSIATAIPYDRPATTMAGFPLCVECQREYEDPEDRRFHAQPIACPACGPKLSWLDVHGVPVAVADPLAHAAARLLAGELVALRGLGGFHLACDARNEQAVRELRRRKHRDQKPLAVMVPDLDTASAVGVLHPADIALLTSPARPIVLVPRRGELAASVSPGLRDVGLFLPYTPLHELLLSLVGRPLVMTSGNRAEEPMAVENAEAVTRLSGIADGFLVHDRPIATRTDDSVARVVEGAPLLLRRARGYVPESLAAPLAFLEPVLAVGGQLKNTFCIGAQGRLTPGPHVGDLDELHTFESYAEMVARMEQFLGVTPQVIAHDLHPDYETTRFARERPARLHLGVQHHHAHVAAVMAEHGLAGPVLGVAFDGTGWGPDGAAWGGEVLLASYAGSRRVATMRGLSLAGGERAIRDAWRIALAVLDDAFDGSPPLEALALFQQVPERDVTNVRQVLRAGEQVVRAHGVGRIFDAAAALLLSRPTVAYEAELAMRLEQHADGAAEPWPFELDRSRDTWEIDLRPMWRALVADVQARRAASGLAARFHATLGAATAATVRALAQRHGPLPVVLSGGCFANALLVGEVSSRLGGFAVYRPSRLPPGDGAIAVGQAIIAAAHLAASPKGAS